MAAILENIYKDKLSEIGKKYNSPIHTSIEIELVEIKPNTYIDFSNEYNIKTPKFKV